jgi:predicted HTH domain antitoxin
MPTRGWRINSEQKPLFTEELLEMGLRPALAVSLYKEGTLPLAKAAKIANISLEGFISLLSKLGVSIVRYTMKDVNEELKDFE